MDIKIRITWAFLSLGLVLLTSHTTGQLTTIIPTAVPKATTEAPKVIVSTESVTSVSSSNPTAASASPEVATTAKLDQTESATSSKTTEPNTNLSPATTAVAAIATATADPGTKTTVFTGSAHTEDPAGTGNPVPTKPMTTQAPEQISTNAPETSSTRSTGGSRSSQATRTIKTQEPAVPTTKSASQEPTVPSTMSESEKPTVPTTKSELEKPTVPTTKSESEKPTVPTTKSASQEPTVPSTMSESEKPTVPTTKSESEKPTVPTTKSESEKPTVPTTKSESQEPTVSTTKSASQEPTVPTTKSASQEPTVHTTKSKSQEPTVHTTTFTTQQDITFQTIAGKIFKTFFMSKGNKENHKDTQLVNICKLLISHLQNDANCSLTITGTKDHMSIESLVSGSVERSVIDQFLKESQKMDKTTMIAIIASCLALLLIILAGFAIYALCHRKPYNKNHQQHLTEELQTVENGYHDNPTLEVMELPPEMQEKKVALNGEFNDGCIIPFDHMRDEIQAEEDTHL
ncbi:hypothetical protein DPEC_G00112930 [Dallia pectoralis]|uniref:Uncharacterized protein n=1 Tax=Dallia pectoralis TaxID=75939 RepID=A0ACC2GTY0_DALPE|nr:hypothetical protein DPEC_G00112930 [Dallia pectoralis]